MQYSIPLLWTRREEDLSRWSPSDWYSISLLTYNWHLKKKFSIDRYVSTELLEEANGCWWTCLWKVGLGLLSTRVPVSTSLKMTCWDALYPLRSLVTSSSRLSGARTPRALRSNNCDYLIRGYSYACGVMDGEKKESNVRTIKIRWEYS